MDVGEQIKAEIETNAPAHLLDSGRAFGESIGWDGQPGYGAGYIATQINRLACGE